LVRLCCRSRTGDSLIKGQLASFPSSRDSFVAGTSSIFGGFVVF